MFDLGKLIPKLPAYAIEHWDRFLGTCFVLVALFQGVTSTNPLLLLGFGLIFLGEARKNWRYVGMIRIGQFSPSYKRTLAYPKVLACVVWLTVCWVCFRYAAINFQITAQWLRRILYY